MAEKVTRGVVVIDAGHGGDDPGALGHGLREADINLGVAKEIERRLSARNYTVLLTREEDKRVKLGARQATGKVADCFVSIHCNAFNGAAHGHEAWYEKGDRTSKDFASVLNKYMAGQFPSIVNRGLKSGSPETRTGWYTFDSGPADCLVELAFIDNAKDVKFLENKYWNDWALALTNAIDQYVSKEAPTDTVPLPVENKPVNIPQGQPQRSSEYDRMIKYEAMVQRVLDHVLPHRYLLPPDAQKLLRRDQIEFVYDRGHIGKEERDRLITEEGL